MGNKALRFTVAFALCILAVSCGRKRNNPQPQDVVEEIPPIGFWERDFSCDTSVVRSGETFSGIMARLGLGSADTYRMTQLCDSVFDVRRIRAGQQILAYYSTSDSLKTLEYAVYKHSYIKSTVFKCRDSLAVWDYEKPVEHQRKFADVTIKSSLWNDMQAQGLADNATGTLIMDLADIYQWSVNFFALQEGDRFRFIYTQSVCDNMVVGIDTVHFCVFNGDDKEVTALRYQPEGQPRAAYWGKDGESLKRMFLKAPLKYNRISSRFTYHRKHPISGKVKAHTAVDYAAPKGTPVHSIGDGTVTLCGWDGSGGGNRIKIKHVQGYESCYMHLSGFAKGIKAGSRVSQGDLIGYVGSTGSSTGPHLDFRIWLNGTPIDPLKLNSPASEPLAKEYLEDFNLKYQEARAELDSLTVLSAL